MTGIKDKTFKISIITIVSIVGFLVAVIFYGANIVIDVANAKEYNKQQMIINKEVGEAIVGINSKLEILLPGYEK